MTPSAPATEEKSSRSYWGLVLIGAVLIVAAALIFWPRAGGRQALSLTVHGSSTNHEAKSISGRIAATNNTDETLVLGGGISVVTKGQSGWKSREQGAFYFHPNSPPSKLLSGQG